MSKFIGAAEFRNSCLQLLEQLSHDGEAVTITKRGEPVAILSPVDRTSKVSLFGAMAGTVLRYDNPFSPTLEPEAWSAIGA